MGAVKQELERMETLGVISKIQEPTNWCSGMVVVPKSTNLRVDLTRLNQSVRRERHPLPAVDQVLAQLAGATVLSKLDTNSGFWQIPLVTSIQVHVTARQTVCTHLHYHCSNSYLSLCCHYSMMIIRWSNQTL